MQSFEEEEEMMKILYCRTLTETNFSKYKTKEENHTSKKDDKALNHKRSQSVKSSWVKVQPKQIRNLTASKLIKNANVKEDKKVNINTYTSNQRMESKKLDDLGNIH